MDIIINAAALAIGAIIGFVVATTRTGSTSEAYEEKARLRIEKSEQEAEKILEEAGEKFENVGERIEKDEMQRLEQFRRMENLIASKEEQLERREKSIEILKEEEKKLNEKVLHIQSENEGGKQKLLDKLSEKTNLTPEKARAEVMNTLEKDLELMREERIRKHEESLEEDKARIAKNMLTSVIQRYSSPTSVEKKSLAIVVQRDELKAKVIGPGAAHLKLLQELTECEIIFNDAPGIILVSCLDLVKKHTARETIMKVLKEREVNEAVIRRKMEEVKKEMEQLLIKIGKQTIEKLELNKRGAYPDEFYRIMGRLKFRTSYGQNILKHSFEVGYFTLMLGAELGVNMETCRIAGFFHDLGKAIDHEVGEPHDHLTKKIMEEFGFPEEEVHAAWAHHDAVPPATPEAMLVKAADAISAGRPGARQETLEKFIEHVRMIEAVANSYEGVKKTFAISAGRELRVIVEPAILEDGHLLELAERIAEDIEAQKAYPGKVKVNIIRRTQSTEYARKQRTKKAA